MPPPQPSVSRCAAREQNGQRTAARHQTESNEQRAERRRRDRERSAARRANETAEQREAQSSADWERARRRGGGHSAAQADVVREAGNTATASAWTSETPDNRANRQATDRDVRRAATQQEPSSAQRDRRGSNQRAMQGMYISGSLPKNISRCFSQHM